MAERFSLPRSRSLAKLMEEDARRKIAILAKPTAAEQYAVPGSQIAEQGLEGLAKQQQRNSLIGQASADSREQAMLRLGITPPGMRQDTRPAAFINADGTITIGPHGAKLGMRPSITAKDDPERLLTTIELSQYPSLKGGNRLKDTFGLQPISPTRQIMSSETTRLAENAKDGLRAIDDMLDYIGRNPTIYRMANSTDLGKIGADIQSNVTGDTSYQDYSNAARRLDDVVTRLRTGAALNKNEEEFYPTLSPGIFDLPAVAANKLRRQRAFLAGVIDRLETGKRIPGEADKDMSVIPQNDVIPAPTQPPKLLGTQRKGFRLKSGKELNLE